MPEEVNRVLTDHVSDLLFTPSEDANQNLEREGISAKQVHLVGNVIIDTLIHTLPRTQERPAQCPDRYALVTLHRASNVDDLGWLAVMLRTLIQISKDLPIVWPYIHGLVNVFRPPVSVLRMARCI